jgi:hypothetical protein
LEGDGGGRRVYDSHVADLEVEFLDTALAVVGAIVVFAATDR